MTFVSNVHPFRIPWVKTCGLTMGLFFSSGSMAVDVDHSSVQVPHNVLTLKQLAIATQNNDPWLAGNRYTQDSIEALSISASTLPDPKVSLGLANIAADSFDFSQEGMTNFKIGISQMIPRGDSLNLRKEQLELLGSQFPHQRLNRKARIIVLSSKLWLAAYKAQESIALIEKDRALFLQLADVAEASYSAALGRTRQQDIVRAQLELTTLDDRLTQLEQQRDMAIKRLNEWLSNFLLDNYNSNPDDLNNQFAKNNHLTLSTKMPDIHMLNAPLYLSETPIQPAKLYEYFNDHPAVLSVDQKIKASKKGIELAKQKYKPEWGVNAGYGVRENDALGNNRSDLFSVGVSFDLPLFTTNRQDKDVQSAVSQSQSIKTEKWLLVRQLMAQFESSRYKLLRLNERRELFVSKLLPQTHVQAEASLTAYTNDDGDFAEVVRARIAELNASIEALSIDVDRQQSIVELNYLFMKQPMTIIQYNESNGESK